MSVCINMWQSWLFIPYNLHSNRLSNIDMFEAYPSGKHKLLSHWYTNSYAFFSKVKFALGFATFDPLKTNFISILKQHYIHFSFDVVLYLSHHVHDRVKNISKHILFYVHDIKVMVEELGLSIRKLLETTSFYLVMSQTNTRKLLLNELETKHNVTILWHHVIILHQKDVGVQHPFQLCQ